MKPLTRQFGMLFVFACMASVAWLVQWMPVDFALGMLFAITIYQLGHYARHGRWIDV